jgi:predicted ester cyclase
MADNKEIVRRVIEEGYNAGNVEILDECCAAGYVNHDSFGGDLDVEGEKELIRTYRNAFPDMRVEIEDLIAEGDLVCARWKASGTHEGEILGLEPTGNSFPTEGLFFGRCEDGKVVEAWTAFDTLGFVRQLRGEEAGAGAMEGESVEVPH